MSMKLTYFNLRGRVEPIRFIMAVGGDTYEDFRVQKAKWPEMKPSTPYGKLPLLEIEGKTVNQTIAIERYLAKKHKLTGKDDFEDLQIDALVDTMVDLGNEVVQFYHEQKEDIKETKKQTIVKDLFPLYLSKFNDVVKKNGGYFVGNRLTWADIHFAATAESMETMVDKNALEGYPELQQLKMRIFDMPQIKAWVAKRPVTPY